MTESTKNFFMCRTVSNVLHNVSVFANGPSKINGGFRWNQPYDQPYKSRVSCKSRGIRYENQKIEQKWVTSPQQALPHPSLSG